MFDSASILARLRNKESIDDIAKDLADALNEANATYEAELAEAEAKAAAAKAEEDRLNESNAFLADILLDLADWYAMRYNTEIPADFDAAATAKDIAASVDKLNSISNSFSSFLSSFSWDPKTQKGEIVEKRDGKTSRKEVKSYNEWSHILEDFFEDIGL